MKDVKKKKQKHIIVHYGPFALAQRAQRREDTGMEGEMPHRL
jgi:hypothetical protein